MSITSQKSKLLTAIQLGPLLTTQLPIIRYKRCWRLLPCLRQIMVTTLGFWITEACSLRRGMNPLSLYTLKVALPSDIVSGKFSISLFIHDHSGKYWPNDAHRLGSEYIGSWTGIDADWTNNKTFVLPNLIAGKTYIITVLLDQMGLDENGIGDDNMKSPRGILDYSLSGRNKSAITWKLTGNFGGESYIDKVSNIGCR